MNFVGFDDLISFWLIIFILQYPQKEECKAEEYEWCTKSEVDTLTTTVMTMNRRDAVVRDLLQKKKKVPTDSL